MLHPDQLQQKKPKKRRMRLPNGYGSVHLIKDGKNRRKPWRARIPSHLEKDKETGNYTQKYINLGYYETEKEAIDALAAYRRDPYDYKAANVTFEQVYEMWSAIAFKDLGESRIGAYRAAYKHSAPLHNLKMRDIKTLQLERVMINTTAGAPTQGNMKMLWSQMFEYALKHDLVVKNYAKLIDTKDKQETSEKRVCIPPEHRAKIWALADAGDEMAKIVLIYIYTGMRVSELLKIEKSIVDREKRLLVGGVKTKAGKNRRVPIHHCIEPIIDYFMAKPGEYLITLNKLGINKPIASEYFREKLWKSWMESHGFMYLPHDCRHTFGTIAREAKIDLDLRKLIMGHSLKDITAHYTHYPDYLLIEAMDCIPDRA